MILNLKDLNEDVEFCHFKMQTFADVLKLFKSSCYMTSLDVKDAYYTIPVVEEYQKYLKFMWKLVHNIGKIHFVNLIFVNVQYHAVVKTTLAHRVS